MKSAFVVRWCLVLLLAALFAACTSEEDRPATTKSKSEAWQNTRWINN
jgi:outer membrane biogenesis lipoprotein LolB